MHKKVMRLVDWVVNPIHKPSERWVYQSNLRRCRMQFRVTFSCISLYCLKTPNAASRKKAGKAVIMSYSEPS